MLFSPYGMLLFPSPGKFSLFQTQVDDLPRSLPFPQTAPVNLRFAACVTVIIIYLFVCMFPKHMAFLIRPTVP